MESFGPATRAWFESVFPGPTEVQERGWPAIARGEHALLAAPTGSGKTLAAFLAAIDGLTRRARGAAPPEPGVRVLYVSPLKALVYDIDRNLRAPLAGIAGAAAAAGLEVALPRVAVRTGDTSAKERRLQAREPAEILVTTPESLYLILGSAAREALRTVETVIVDEVHALAPGKRGAHLALSLERLAWLSGRDPQRIGLSATARPLAEVARYLGGDRRVEIVDATRPPLLDLEVVVPVADMTRPEETALVRAPEDAVIDTGMWAAIQPALLDLIRGHRQTIVFVNSRSLAERLTRRLNELAEEPLARAHHGSLAHGERRHIEEQLAAGAVRAIVATSSLELGIDMGAVDLVVLIESPSSVASGLQRIGRAGHGVGEISIGRLLPKHRGDLLAATVVAERMRAGAIEAIAVPNAPLDVLAQHVVAAVSVDPWPVGELAAVIRRAASYAELPDSAYLGTLDMLAGRYPSTAFAELRARIDWDRHRDRLTPRRGARMLAITGGGTIPDRGTYRVVLGEGGPRLGELDEEMVNETTPGQVFALGASSWRVLEVTRDQVVVAPAPGEPGKLPFWRGDGPGRPIELGRALGALVRELCEGSAEAARERLARAGLDDAAADNLLAYLAEQREAGAVPTDRRIVLERFRDELGDLRVCVLTPFGARVHAPWAMALEATLGGRFGIELQSLWTDDGIALRFPDADELPEPAELIPDPDRVGDLVVSQLAGSALFAGQFRENAARALLLPRRRPGERTPLWLQRLKSQQLLAVAREFPAFPIVMETYRACLQDVFDMAALTEILGAAKAGAIEIEDIECRSPSPFARSLAFAYTAAFLYQGDSPAAERRAQALALDRDLLRELLGDTELRELLDPGAIAAVEEEIAAAGAGDAEQILDRLRRLGDRSAAELAAPAEALAGLLDVRQAFAISIAGEERWIAAEDAGLYHAALAAEVPAWVPAAFLAAPADPLADVVLRFARGRGPFTATELAARYGLAPETAAEVLAALAARRALESGGFRPGGAGLEHCHPEVLRRIKQKSLAALRREVAAVDTAVLGRFLPAWHGIGSRRRGRSRLEEVLAQLEGLALPFAELESAILPARVADFSPRMLDELGALGWLVWTGSGGAAAGKVSLYRRENAAALIEPPAPPEELGAMARAIRAELERAGASFFVGLSAAVPEATQSDVLEALWELVFAGLVTNDTFGPLRGRGLRRPSGRRGQARHLAQVAGGRWSLVSELCRGAPPLTEGLHRRAVGWLERHGIVCRESATIEDLPGGFSTIYPVLGAMEEAGRIRRGYFVEGLGGAQFALAGAIDRLRAAASRPTRDLALLAAADPANPFGWLAPWPPTLDPTGPRRAAGAWLILEGGEPIWFLDRGGRRLVSFAAATDRDRARAAAAAFLDIARRRRGRTLRIATLDGEPARSAPLAAALLERGFYADTNGLTLEVPR